METLIILLHVLSLFLYHWIEKDEVHGPRVMDFLEGPELKVMTFKTNKVNGYKFLSSGSCTDVKGTLHKNCIDYYNQVQEIVRLIYQRCNHVYGLIVSVTV